MRALICIITWLIAAEAHGSAIYGWQDIAGAHAGSLEISDAAYTAGHVQFSTPRFIFPTEPYAPGDVIQFRFDAAGFGPQFINGDYDFDLVLTGNGLGGVMNIFGLETTVLMTGAPTLWTINEYRTDIFGACYLPSFADCSGDTGRWVLLSAPGLPEPSTLLLILVGVLLVFSRRQFGKLTQLRRTLVGRKFMVPFAVSVGLLSSTASASATTILIDTSFNEYRPGLENQGWWPPTLGYSNNSESDYHLVGWSAPGFSDTEVRSFFSFYLDPTQFNHMTVTSATFIVRKGDSGGDAAQETLSLFDVTSPLATVMHNVSTNFSVWSDLGTGPFFGTFSFSVGGNSEENLVIPLTAAALTAINADIGGYFTIGAAITTGYGFLFRDSPGSLGVQALALELVPVPEPPTATLVALALGMLSWGRIVSRRR